MKLSNCIIFALLLSSFTTIVNGDDEVADKKADGAEKVSEPMEKPDIETTSAPSATTAPVPTQAPNSKRAPVSTRAPNSKRAPVSTRAPKSKRAPVSTRAPNSKRAPISTRAPRSKHSSVLQRFKNSFSKFHLNLMPKLKKAPLENYKEVIHRVNKIIRTLI